MLSNLGGTAQTARENSGGGEDAFDAFLRREARISDVAVIVRKTPNPIPYRPLSEIVASELAHHILERDFARPGRSQFDAGTYAANYRRRLDRYLGVAQRLMSLRG